MKRSRALSIRRAGILCSLALCSIAAYAQGPTVASSGLAGVSSLEEAREKLFRMRDNSRLPGAQQQMMDLAKDPGLEQRLRGNPLGELMEGVPFKETGSPPAQSRGLMSDIDRTVSRVDDFEKIKARAIRRGYRVEETPYRIKIHGLDTVIWKPQGKSSALADTRTSLAERARVLASDPEFALEAGRKAGAHAFMSVAENLTKGGEALLGDLSKLPPWKAELELVAGAKDVLRSLNASGMCGGEMKSVCAELDAIKSMKQPPGNPAHKQRELRGLMGKAFEKSQMLLDIEMDALLQRMRDAVDPGEIEHLERRVAELRAQMTEGVERFKLLEQKYPHEMRRMSGGKSVAQIRDDMVRRGVRLEEGRRKLTGDQAARGRAGDRARKVEKITVVVDALQFVECLHQEGQDVTSCLKEAAQGLVVGAALSQGIYYLSLVSERGAVVATGFLTYAGLGATLYYTGVKLGEAAYEADELWKALREEREALTRMEASQRARVQNLALQLEKLEAKVKGFVTDTAERRKAAMADLERYEKLSAILREAKSFRRRHGARLDRILELLARAEPHCSEIVGTVASLRRTLTEAEAMARRVEELLQGAQQRVQACSGRDAVEAGDVAYQQAQELVSRSQGLSLELDRQNLHGALAAFRSALDEAAGEPRFGTGRPVSSDLDSGNGPGDMPNTGNTLDEGRAILARLKAYAAQAEANLVDIVSAADRVGQIEAQIETQKQAFKREFHRFKDAFPEQLTREWVEQYGFPQQAAATWLHRLDRLAMTVDAVQFVDRDAWRNKSRELMAENHGLGADAKLFIQYARKAGSRLDGIQGAIGACMTGRDDTARAAEDVIDRIDTQQTLTGLAFAKLGEGYRELQAACTQKLAGSSPAPAPGAEPDENETFNPVHLFELLDKAGKTVFTLYARAEPSHLFKDRFRFPDGGGGYYHNKGKDLGVYRDQASLCAVLRGKGVFSVSYNLGSWSVVCAREGPVAEAGGTAAGGNEPPRDSAPAAGRMVVETVTGDVGYSLDPSGTARPVPKDQALPAGATLRVGEGGSARLRLGANGSVAVGPGTRVTWRPASGAAQAVAQLELSAGELAIHHSTAGGDRRQDAPGFDGLEVVTPHARIRPIGTRYTVNTDAQGTRVRVLAGRVQLTGTLLARTDAAYQLPGKVALRKELTLEAGQYGRAFTNPVGASAVPGWIGGTPGAGQAPPAVPDPSAGLPGWLAPGQSATPTADPARDGWRIPTVQAWMDQWLREARPAVSKAGLSFRYSDWGVLLSSAAKAAGAPEHPSGWTRHRYLWERRDKLGSWNLCTLGEYLRRRQAGGSLADCVRPEPKPAPGVAGGKADSGGEGATPKGTGILPGWLGGWSCEARAPGKQNWTTLLPFALSRAGERLFLHYRTQQFPLPQVPKGDRFTLTFDFPGQPVVMELRLKDDRLTGSQSWSPGNNVRRTDALRCARSTNADMIQIFGRR